MFDATTSPEAASFDTLYRSARGRVGEIAGSLTDAQLATHVAGSPEWTGHQVVSHLAGVSADAAAGNMEGAPGPQWTAAQVAARTERTIPELLAEWEQFGPFIEQALAHRLVGLPPIMDVLTHEADLRETFDLGKAPAEEFEPVGFAVAKWMVARYRGSATLTVRTVGSDGADHEWTGGDGPPLTVAVAPYELFRGLISRRSRAQMRTWDWSGDLGPDETAAAIDALPLFGPRDDDQPQPN